MNRMILISAITALLLSTSYADQKEEGNQKFTENEIFKNKINISDSKSWKHIKEKVLEENKLDNMNASIAKEIKAECLSKNIYLPEINLESKIYFYSSEKYSKDFLIAIQGESVYLILKSNNQFNEKDISIHKLFETSKIKSVNSYTTEIYTKNNKKLTVVLAESDYETKLYLDIFDNQLNSVLDKETAPIVLLNPMKANLK